MKKDERVTMGGRLREARERAGLTQEDVAEAMSLPRPAISQMENGRRRVEALELARLAKLYHCPMAFFTGAPAEDEKTKRLETLHRTAAGLSDSDRDEVLRFAEFLRQRADSVKRKP